MSCNKLIANVCVSLHNAKTGYGPVVDSCKEIKCEFWLNPKTHFKECGCRNVTITGPAGKLIDVNLHGLFGGEIRILSGAWLRIQNVIWENVPIWHLPLKPAEALFGLFEIAEGGTYTILLS